MGRVVSLSGLLVMMFLAWGISVDRKRMNIRLILSGSLAAFMTAAIAGVLI